MRIAQITDLHVSDNPDGPRRFVDANERLASVVATLNDLVPAPDVILLTGDLVDDGTDDQYDLLRGLLEPLTIPILPIPGNHDLHDGFRRCFADVLPAGVALDHCSYSVEPVDPGSPRLVGFDSSDPGRIDGVAPADRLEWLEACLADAPDTPTLLFLHHPPFETTIWWMDVVGMAIADAAALRTVIARHRQVQLVVCGHIHRPIHSRVGSARVSVCPSTTHQVGLAVVEESVPKMVAEPGAFQLHIWTGEEFITHTERFGEGAATVQLDSLAGEMKALKALRESRGSIAKTDLDTGW